MYTSTTSYRAGYKILAIILAAIMLITLLPVAVNVNGLELPNPYFEIDADETVAEIQAALQDEIDGISDAGGGTVTVTGSKTDADATLELVIPEGVTVVWDADYSGTVGNNETNDALIELKTVENSTLGGKFILTGSLKNIAKTARVINVIGSIAVEIDGGDVYAESTNDGGGIAIAIFSEGGGDVTVTSGMVISNGMLILAGASDVLISGGTVTNDFKDFEDDVIELIVEGAIIANDITITGGKVTANAAGIGIVSGSINISGDAEVTANAYYKAESNGNKEIFGDGLYAVYDVTISGGTVSATGGDSGITSRGNIIISGGDVTAIGSEDGIVSSGYWYGPEKAEVYINGVVEISGGTVTAIGETYSGILADYVTITDGTVTAVGKWYGIVSYFAENQDETVDFSDYLGSVTISGGTVTATGANTPSVGILAGEEIAISGTNTIVTASGTWGKLSAEQIYSLFYIEEEDIDEDIYLGGAFDIFSGANVTIPAGSKYRYTTSTAADGKTSPMVGYDSFVGDTAYKYVRIEMGVTDPSVKLDQDAPGKPTLYDEASATTIMVQNDSSNKQYAISTTNSVEGLTWDGAESPGYPFFGLTPNTTYYVFVRLAANETYNASLASEPLVVNTAMAKLTGELGVSGTLKYGETLTAVTSGLTTNVPGYTDFGTLSYQWARYERGRGSDYIPGATNASYTLTAADIGFEIVLIVKSTNCTGQLDANMNARIVVTKADGLVPALDFSVSDTDGGFPKTITITPVDGAEYNFGEGYGSENFIISEDAEEIVLRIRLEETLTHNASGASTITINTANQNQDTPAPFELNYTANAEQTSYTVTIPPSDGAEYSFDGVNWSDTNSKTALLLGDTVIGYKRM
ncbi:hypothetical protein FACS1894219_01320 [Clostridia bacterium]|nr:hypothetical protein FACS1894219_01320 [Clostridia bacterium]